MKLLEYNIGKQGLAELPELLKQENIPTVVDGDEIYFKIPSISEYTIFSIDPTINRVSYSEKSHIGKVTKVPMIRMNSFNSSGRLKKGYILIGEDFFWSVYGATEVWASVAAVIVGFIKNPEGKGFFNVSFRVEHAFTSTSTREIVNYLIEENLNEEVVTRNYKKIEKHIITGVEDFEIDNTSIMGYIFVENPVTKNFIKLPGINTLSIVGASKWTQYGNILVTGKHIGLPSNPERLHGRGMVVLGLREEDANDIQKFK